MPTRKTGPKGPASTAPTSGDVGYETSLDQPTSDRRHLRRKGGAPLFRSDAIRLIKKARPTIDPQSLELFFMRLAGIALQLQALTGIPVAAQKGRQRDIDMLVTGLLKVAEALERLDGQALAAAFFHGAKNLTAIGAVPDAMFERYWRPPFYYGDECGPPWLVPQVASEAAAEQRPQLVACAAALADGAREAKRSLPHGDFDPQLRAALSLAELFFQCGLPFTKTDGGLAGICAGHVFDLAEMPRPDIKHLLNKATSHPDFRQWTGARSPTRPAKR